MFEFDNSFAREFPELCVAWSAATAPSPELLVLNGVLASELGADPVELSTSAGTAILVGNAVVGGATPVAQAYSGHQFGGFSPRLGDGRALLLGEIFDNCGRRRDVHLKGSGRTPFARGGDGKAAVGPMLREYVISEAMHALGIPTTRSLAVVATGELIAREGATPGAVLVRVAASHLRVGTFQYAATQDDPNLVRRLADYAIARHQPGAATTNNPHLAFFEAVVDAQAALVAQWMLVGFIHGVMNTDNMTISGETIDYGPCAFLDTYDPATVFSSIDHSGRYAFGNQPAIAHWNLARLAETLLGLFAVENQGDVDGAVAIATEILETFPDRYHGYWEAGMRAKLGLRSQRDGDPQMIEELLATMVAQRVDFTSLFRALSASLLRGGEIDQNNGQVQDQVQDQDQDQDQENDSLLAMFGGDPAFDVWRRRWLQRLQSESPDLRAAAVAMDEANPLYIPRNHLVDHALTAATGGDLTQVRRLIDVLARPFEQRSGLEQFAEPAPANFGPFQTFCGT